VFHENHRSAQANVRLLLSPKAFFSARESMAGKSLLSRAQSVRPPCVAVLAEDCCGYRPSNWRRSGAYNRLPIYIPLCFWSLASNWLDSGLIVLQGVPFVQRIRTTSACE